jgi:hypothetical protein
MENRMIGAHARMAGLKTAGLLAVWVAFAIPLWAAAPSPDEVQQLMVLSGLDRQIPQVPAAITLGFDRQQGKLKPAQAALVRQEMIASYQAQKMSERVQAALREGWKQDLMGAEREWLSAPLGRRLTAMEIEGNSVDAETQWREFARRPYQNPPPERVDAIARMIHAAGLNESALDNVMAVMTAAMIGVNSGQRPENRLTLNQIAAIIREARKNYAEPLRNEILLRNLYTYRDASQAELESYAQFLDSPAAKYFNGLVAKALREAIQAASADFADRLRALADKLTEMDV